MAEGDRADNDIDIRRAEIYAGVEKVSEFHKTLRTIAIVLGTVIAIGLVSWAAVRITAKEGWVVVTLAIVGPNGVILTIFGIVWKRLEKEKRELLNREDDQ